MQLEDALKISAVTRKIEGKKMQGGVAKRPYEQLSGVTDKCYLAFSPTIFQIAWVDTFEAIEVGLNPDFNKVFKYNDWEPV